MTLEYHPNISSTNWPNVTRQTEPSHIESPASTQCRALLSETSLANTERFFHVRNLRNTRLSESFGQPLRGLSLRVVR